MGFVSRKTWCAATLAAAMAIGAGGEARGDASVAAKVAVARERVASLAYASASIEGALRAARATKHRERAACLDDVLSQSHAATRYGQSLRTAIEAAVTAGDVISAERSFVRLLHLGERAGRLLGEASRCGVRAPPVVLRAGTFVRVYTPKLPSPPAFPTR